MKRYLMATSVVALGIAAPAFAQQSSNVDQIGSYSKATVDQTSTGDTINDSDIDQIGVQNMATVGQSGTGKLSNKSVIWQGDVLNTAKVTQGGNEGINYSNIRQFSDGDVAGGNKADASQTTINYGENRSTIEQLGAGNDAIASQSASFDGTNTSGIFQRGIGNRSSVTQSSTGADNESRIEQGWTSLSVPDSWGEGNIASVTQAGQSTNKSGVYQHGDLNNSTVEQSSAFGLVNSVYVFQSGSANSASVTQK
jgi:hypothetical protein